MSEDFKCIKYNRSDQKKVSLDFLNLETARKVQRFHSSFDVYKPTPLIELKNLAVNFGLKNIYVKDESFRFGINAFKVLGGSFAIGNYLANKLNKDIDELPYETMISSGVKDKIGNITFITATDGNHGRGVAWTANKLKQKCIVYMPKGSAIERFENIKAEGAEVYITDMNYDDAVRYAKKIAEETGGVMVQDTAWNGYEDIPTWIMQGYTSMAYEAYNQLKEKPTHIFLQAGVGSMAGAITGFFASVYGDDRPIVTIVESNKADCIYKTAESKDGKLHFVTGDMDTIMAGLACGEPNKIGWEVLGNYADNFVSCPDYVTAKGMRVLGNPIDNDKKVISGESGAVGLGLVAEVMTNPNLKWLKEKLSLDENSKVLSFSTEGDTYKKNYRSVVWDGKYPSYDFK